MLTELREELRRRGAPTQGRYEELVARLDRLVVAELAEEVEQEDDGVGGLSRASHFGVLDAARLHDAASSSALPPRLSA